MKQIRICIELEGEGILGPVRHAVSTSIPTDINAKAEINGAGVKRLWFCETKSEADARKNIANKRYMEQGCYGIVDNNGMVICEAPFGVYIDHVEGQGEGCVTVWAKNTEEDGLHRNPEDRIVLTITKRNTELNDAVMDGLSEKNNETTKMIVVATLNRYGKINDRIRENNVNFKSWDDAKAYLDI